MIRSFQTSDKHTLIGPWRPVAFLRPGPLFALSRLLVQQPDLPHQVSLFLALLEMAKSRQLRIRQHKEFDDIGLTLQLAE